jgi:hypothetical protein
VDAVDGTTWPEPVDWYCHAKRLNAAGEIVGYCHARAGWGTGSHVGIGRCKMDLGTSPSHVRAATKVMAERECAALGLPTGTSDPIEALRNGLARADGMVNGLGEQLAKLKEATVTDHLGDQQRHALEIAYQTWVDTSARIATAMARLGLDARELAFRESEVSAWSAVMLAVFDDADFGLTHAQRNAGRQILARHLRRIAIESTGSSPAAGAVDAPSSELGQ